MPRLEHYRGMGDQALEAQKLLLEVGMNLYVNDLLANASTIKAASVLTEVAVYGGHPPNVLPLHDSIITDRTQDEFEPRD